MSGPKDDRSSDGPEPRIEDSALGAAGPPTIGGASATDAPATDAPATHAPATHAASPGDHPTLRAAEAAVRRWVERLVVAHDLCPFAASPLRAGAVRFVATDARDLPGLLTALQAELQRLLDTPPADLATTLLVVPHILADFEDYLDALDLVELALEDADLADDLQVASFHPDYRFEDTDDEVTAYTNRTPHPVFHLLRTAEVAHAIDTHPDVEGIPDRNVAHMRSLGLDAARRLLASCVDGD